MKMKQRQVPPDENSNSSKKRKPIKNIDTSDVLDDIDAALNDIEKQREKDREELRRCGC